MMQSVPRILECEAVACNSTEYVGGGSASGCSGARDGGSSNGTAGGQLDSLMLGALTNAGDGEGSWRCLAPEHTADCKRRAVRT